jgi:antitoxin VapB
MSGVIKMQSAKLFANGNSQAVRLPKDCRFTGDEVYAQRIGEAVLLFPKERVWETFLEGINGFTEDYFTAIEEARAEELPSPRETL